MWGSGMPVRGRSGVCAFCSAGRLGCAVRGCGRIGGVAFLSSRRRGSRFEGGGGEEGFRMFICMVEALRERERGRSCPEVYREYTTKRQMTWLLQRRRKHTSKSTFSASECLSNFKLNCPKSHTLICGLYVPVAITCFPSRVVFTLLLASGNSKCWMSSMEPSTCSRIARLPFAFTARLRVSQSGREEEEPAGAPLTV